MGGEEKEEEEIDLPVLFIDAVMKKGKNEKGEPRRRRGRRRFRKKRRLIIR